jgi:hypothetical protein
MTEPRELSYLVPVDVLARGHRRRMAARQTRDGDRPWLGEAAYRLVSSLDLPGQDIPPT